jgi:hypothetical protein
VLVRVVEVQRSRKTSRTRLLAGTGVAPHSIERWPIGNVRRFDSGKYRFELKLLDRECVVLESGRTPRRQLKLKISTCLENGERPVLSFF